MHYLVGDLGHLFVITALWLHWLRAFSYFQATGVRRLKGKRSGSRTAPFVLYSCRSVAGNLRDTVHYHCKPLF